MSIELQNDIGLTPSDVVAAELMASPTKPSRPARTTLQWIGVELRKAPVTAWFGLIVITAYLLVALLAPVLAPYGESVLAGNSYEPWSREFIFGTDQLG